MRKLPVVGVIGSGTDAHRDISVPLGKALAKRPLHLLTGGGQGVMAAVAEAFCSVSSRHGLSIGVLPASEPPNELTPPPGYPNRWIDLSIHTHLFERGERGAEPLSRNHINVLTADVIIALPGGAGTMTEIALARRYGKSVVAYGRERRTVPESVPMAMSLPEIEAFIDIELFAG